MGSQWVQSGDSGALAEEATAEVQDRSPGMKLNGESGVSDAKGELSS